MKKPSRRRIDSFVYSVETWFAQNGRKFPWRKSREPPFKKIVAEVLLQRTQAQTVATFYGAFFKRFPSWQALYSAEPAAIEEFLKPIGLWRRRAASLKNLAAEMIMRRGIFPKTREELETIPAVGQYVASAILMFAYGEGAPLLDVNMARVLERYFGPRQLVDIRYDPWLKYISHAIVKKVEPAIINWAILDLGALVCMARRPRCEQCPLWAGCLWRKQNFVAMVALEAEKRLAKKTRQPGVKVMS